MQRFFRKGAEVLRIGLRPDRRRKQRALGKGSSFFSFSGGVVWEKIWGIFSYALKFSWKEAGGFRKKTYFCAALSKEECQSDRMGRTRNPLYGFVRTGGLNPSSSANKEKSPGIGSEKIGSRAFCMGMRWGSGADEQEGCSRRLEVLGQGYAEVVAAVRGRIFR